MKKFFVLFTLFFALFSITLTTGCGGGGGGSDDNEITYPDDSDVNTPPVATTSTKRISTIVFSGDRSQTETLTYDADGFITDIARTGDTTYYMTFEFDTSGNPTKIVAADGTYIPDGETTAIDDIKTITYTYQDGKPKTETEVDPEETTTLTWDAWTGYIPTSGTFVEGAFSMDVISTINADGKVTSWSGTSSGVSIFRENITYTATGYTNLEEDYESDSWVKKKKTVITVDSSNKITKRELTEWENDGSYNVKTLTYAYNSDGNVATITFVRQDYTSGGALVGAAENYEATITYTTATSRPACNDILQDDRYALEYLD